MLSKLIGSSSVPPANIINVVGTAIAATAVAITLPASPADAQQRYVIHGLQWSYSAAPVGGRLTIVSTTGSKTELDIDITAAGPGALGTPISGVFDSAVVITLSSGAGSVIGKLNVQYIKESS